MFPSSPSVGCGTSWRFSWTLSCLKTPQSGFFSPPETFCSAGGAAGRCRQVMMDASGDPGEGGGLSASFLLNFSLTFWMSVIKSKTFETDDPFFSQNSLTKLEKFYRKGFPVESDCRSIWIFMIQTWEETSDKRVNGSPHQSRHVFDVITWSDCFCQFVWVSGDLLPRAGVSGRFHVVLWRQRSLGIE